MCIINLLYSTVIVNKVRKFIIRKCSLATASVHWYNACRWYERIHARMKRVHIWQGQTEAFKLPHAPLFLVCLCIKQGM